MFRAMFSSIIRSIWLYLQYLLVFTQADAGWCLEWVETGRSPVSTHSKHQQAVTWVNTTRCCKYSQMLLIMDENIAWNM
jgi:hypothetical protein